ncbi:MAG: shikimate kinase [Candidatus Sumerlaeia bacterium]|nr:shikimate kinase [Candidatus Sumerlaeia bacterium]
MSQRCVTLIGPMGAGKTDVGSSLAEILGYDFIDTDKLIEKKAGKKIAAIFSEQGEPAFRQLEAEVISKLADETSKVLATGGGAVIDPQNRHVFETIGLTVYLKATPRELYQRIKNDTSRPLLAGKEDPRGEIKRILTEREHLYLEADITIDTEDLSVEEVVDVLIDELAKRTVGD